MTEYNLAAEAQDEFARLVEENRIGTLYRPVFRTNPNRTIYVSHRSGIDLSDLPVFFLGEQPVFAGEPAALAMEAVMADQFRLPYARCGFMHHMGAGHPSLLAASTYPNNDPRWYMVLAEQEDDGRIIVTGFMRHKPIDHWTRQIWQGVITSGAEGAITIAWDPKGNAPDQFLEFLFQSTEDRITLLLGEIHRMMTGRGRSEYATGTALSERIDQRRVKMKLPPVQRVRAIDFDALPTAPTGRENAKGTRKAPHFRRGSWHVRKATGKKSWHPPSAIHGGGGDAPPWYEVRMPAPSMPPVTMPMTTIPAPIPTLTILI
jgi:hypothetical protein